MSYRSMVLKQVRNAFRLIGDLAINVTFLGARATEFDFGSSEAVISTSASKSIKAVKLETKREPSDGSTNTMSIMIIAADVGDLSDYDSVKIDGDTWNIVGHISNDYTINIDLSKE